MTTILNDVKKVLGIGQDFQDFDVDVLLHINSAAMTAEQVGVNRSEAEIVVSTDWSYFTNLQSYSALKTWLILTVRLAFDPPSTSFQTSAIEKQLEQLSWRIREQIASKWE